MSSPPSSPTRRNHPHPSPTQVFHPASSIIPTVVLPNLLGSAAGGTHYSGAKVRQRRSDVRRASLGSGSRTVELDEQRSRLLDDLKELYECRPTLEILNRAWRHDAVYEDPLTCAVGLEEITSQWNSLRKLLSQCDVVSRRVLSSTHNPNKVVFMQTLEYTFRIIRWRRSLDSMIIIELDDNGQIIRLEDQWNGQELPSRWGASMIRRLNGRTASWLFRAPKHLRKHD